MNSLPIIPFFKRELRNPIFYIILSLSIISGASIIYSREYLKGPFRLDNVYSMFAAISELGLILLAVNIFGQEYQSKTINNILASGYTIPKLTFSKMLVFLGFALFISLVSYGEVAVYTLLFHYPFEWLKILISLILAYLFYGFFIGTLSMLITVVSKSFSKALIIVILVNSFVPTVIGFFPKTSFFKQLMNFIPFSFVSDRFAFASFSEKEIIVMFIWGCIFYMLTTLSLKKNGNQ